MIPGSGNFIVDAQDALKVTVCPICDEENGHSCIDCGCETSEKACIGDREGRCVDCDRDFVWALKH